MIAIDNGFHIKQSNNAIFKHKYPPWEVWKNTRPPEALQWETIFAEFFREKLRIVKIYHFLQ